MKNDDKSPMEKFDDLGRKLFSIPPKPEPQDEELADAIGFEEDDATEEPEDDESSPSD